MVNFTVKIIINRIIHQVPASYMPTLHPWPHQIAGQSTDVSNYKLHAMLVCPRRKGLTLETTKRSCSLLKKKKTNHLCFLIIVVISESHLTIQCMNPIMKMNSYFKQLLDFLFLFHSMSSALCLAQLYIYPSTASFPSTWINSPSSYIPLRYNGQIIRPILNVNVQDKNEIELLRFSWASSEMAQRTHFRL